MNRICAVACEYASVFLTVCVYSQTPQGQHAPGYSSSEAANSKNMLESGFEKVEWFDECTKMSVHVVQTFMKVIARGSKCLSFYGGLVI